MSLTIALNWWQMCLVIVAVMIALLYWIDKTAVPGQFFPDTGAMIMGLLVFVGGIAIIIGIIVGKFVFGGG